ncbi:homeo protein [Cucurbitaria berberidis CBS 394.84]|uniref:Homeo protein n=1 Tax=Cucurbitaria berberidis CBS 394.84 TaxID=1168544 RepID=A0A9P4LA95_9PLEO|nr:homeo protein [Cucurbitaria berberidis CBS 394.84]KAF1847223.1 homeo protein [Cucurbitaria berberidis CBS 394.84]
MQSTDDAMLSPTPSPSAHTPTQGSAPRRPPRKSTLTQQQRNQKRQRATQDQLVTLEIEFNKNPTPTAATRERIASDINMTERSVQIWFQNRRAKIKNIAKKSIENGDDCNDIPESMRRYLALQAMESGKPIGTSFLGRAGGALPYGSGMLLNTDTSTSKVVIHHFACRSLSVGSWRRVGQSAMDLVIFYSPEKCCVTYYINNDSAGYKIEYPFSYIKNISLENGDMTANAEGASQRPGGLVVELNRPPNFFMDSSGSGGFFQCGDFTEDQQASNIMIHHLGGHPKVLSGQLAKLVSLESFQNRHNLYDPNTLTVSAPVSPINHRPASQPNHLVHPHMGMYNESHLAPGPFPPRGHKRQRSRSVPVAIDFSMLRNPMPSFMMQPEPSPYIQNPEIFAPIPQSAPGPIGPHLSIDTSAGYGMDYRQYPMSATTANSPSDYGTPAFYTSGPPTENVPASNFGQYNIPPYVHTPMGPPPHSAVGNSPMPAMSHPDPIIANQSPPLGSFGRDHHQDVYPMSDEAMQMTDMYAKQNLNLPFRSPLMDENVDDLDMQSYLTMDPSSLSPEHHQM